MMFRNSVSGAKLIKFKFSSSGSRFPFEEYAYKFMYDSINAPWAINNAKFISYFQKMNAKLFFINIEK